MKKIFLPYLILLITGTGIFFSCKKERSCEGCKENNKPPIAVAGPDQVITLPADSILLDGRNSSDPDGTISEWLWTKISGPASFTIIKPTDSTTAVKTLITGSYQFELKVTDASGLFSKDTMQVTVNAAVSTNTCNGNVQIACDGSMRQQVCAQLIPVANLSVKRWEMAVASAGNKILFAGGWLGGGGFSSRVDIYDITSNSWTTAELSQARANMATAVLGNKIFFAGGDNDLGNGNWYETSDIVDIYDASSNSWTTATLSEKRTFMIGSAAANKVLFAGGATYGLGANGESRKIDIYNNATNTWSIDYLPAPGGPGIVATVIDHKIYFAGSAANWFAWDFGGWYSSAINIYDAATGNWSTASLSEEKGPLGAIAVGNKNYWAGGFNVHFGQTTNLPVNKVEIMDMSTGSIRLECLFQPNSGCAAVQKNFQIVFFTPHTTQNGWLPTGMVTNKFDIYDLNSNRWSIGVLPANIYDASVISVNNIIYVAGGIVNSSLSNQVWKLEF